MLSMIGAILGGLVFGYYSDKRRPAARDDDVAMVLRLVVGPVLDFGATTRGASLIGVFLMQFFVQGAWGVVPAHINELSPDHLRGFFPGFAYQLGVMFAASIPYRRSGAWENASPTRRRWAVSSRWSSSSPSSWCCSARRRRASVSESSGA